MGLKPRVSRRSPANALIAGVDAPEALAGYPPSSAWEGIQHALERGLEGWVEAVARADKTAGVAAAAAVVQHALPIARRNYEASKLDYGGPDEGWAGWECAPVEQLSRVRAWLDSGGNDELPALTADYTRQLSIWDDDLRPAVDSPAGWYIYFVEATNLLAFAVLHGADGGPYGTWSHPACAARAAVCAFKSMNAAGSDRRAGARALIDAIRSSAPMRTGS